MANVFVNKAPTAAMKVIEPDASGDRPKPTCSISGRRNGMAPMPMRNSEAADDAGAEGLQFQQAELHHRMRRAARMKHE